MAPYKETTALIPLPASNEDSAMGRPSEPTFYSSLELSKTSSAALLFDSRFKLYALYSFFFFTVTLFVFCLRTLYPGGSVTEASSELFDKVISAFGVFSFSKALLITLPELAVCCFAFLSGLTIFGPFFSAVLLVLSFSCKALIYESVLSHAFANGAHLFCIAFTLVFAVSAFLEIVFFAEVSKFSKLAYHGVKRIFRTSNLIPYFLCFLFFSFAYFAIICVTFLLFCLV